MNVLEKILEEINEKIKFAERMMVEKPCDKLDETVKDAAGESGIKKDLRTERKTVTGFR